MKRLFLTVSLILLMSAFWTGSLSAQEISGPKLVLKEQEVHLKEVMEGKVAEHVFKVFNRGDKPLKIMNVRPG